MSMGVISPVHGYSFKWQKKSFLFCADFGSTLNKLKYCLWNTGVSYETLLFQLWPKLKLVWQLKWHHEGKLTLPFSQSDVGFRPGRPTVQSYPPPVAPMQLYWQSSHALFSGETQWVILGKSGSLASEPNPTIPILWPFWWYKIQATVTSFWTTATNTQQCAA